MTRVSPRSRAAGLAALVALATLPALAGPSEVDETALAYCSNLADAANDARFARKLARLQAVEESIEGRLAALEEKRAEYENWLERRQQFLDLARESLVTIYSGMRPDAASEQLAAMNELTAAAVIAQVEPRTASAILNEMETQKAARLATIVAGLSQTEEPSS